MDHQRYPPYHPSLAGSGRYGEEHVEDGRATERASRLRPVDLRNNPDASNNNRWYYAATNSSSTHHPRFCGPSEADGAAFPVFPAEAASEDDDRSYGQGTDSTDGNPFPPPSVLGSSRTRHRKQRCSSESVACSLPPRSRGYEAASNAYRESTAPYYDRYSSDSSIWAREASRESVGNSSSERTTSRVVDPPTKIPLSSSSSWASGVALRSVSSPSGQETSAGRLSRHREEEGAESCCDHYSIRSVPRKRARLDEALEGCGGETSSNNRLIGRSFPEKTAIGDQTHSVCEDFPSSYKIRGSYTKPESSYHKTSVGSWQNSSFDVRGPRDFVSLPENAVLKEMQTRSDNFPIDLDANDTRVKDLGRGDYQQSHRTHLLLAGRAFVSYPEGVPEISAAACRNSQPTDVPFPAHVSSSRDATESFHRVANRSLPIRRSSSRFEDSCVVAACKKPSMAEEPYASRRSCSGNHPDYALDSSSLKYKMLQDERMLSGESSLINSPNLDENVNTSVSTSVTVPSLGSCSGFGCRTDKMCKDYEILDKASNKNYSILPSCAQYEIVEHPRGVELKSHKGTKSMCASTSTRETDVAANHRTSKSNYRNTHLKSHRDKTRSPSSPKQSGIGAPHGVTRRRRRRAIGLVCGVCGDTARSLHFGGISCDSCKAFFRRAIIAKAYPSFLCVTTGLPLRIKQQTKEEAKYTNDKTEGRLGTRTNFSNDLSTFESTSTPYNMQKTPKVSLSTPLFQDVDAHKLGSDHQNVNQNLESTNICSVSKSSLPETVSKDSESANSSSVCAVSVDVIGKLAFTSNKSSVCDVPKSARDEDASISSGALVVKNKEALLHSSEATLRSGCVGTLSRCPPITITTRKYCQACRFQQCIDIGMEISWVTLENDAQRKMVDQAIKGGDTRGDDSRDYSIANKEESFSKTKEFSDAGLNDDLDANDDCGPNKYLTKDEQRQIEDLVDIYRSVFWGVPEPVYHRPALIDFPPAFLNESLHANKSSCSQSTSHISTSESNAQHENAQASEEYCLANDLPKAPSESPTKSESDRQTNEDEIPLSEMTMDDIRSLPRDPCGVNMFRKALGRRPRPWLIRQLMGYTLRFMYVVVKLLQSVGRSLSTTDRTVLLRQGMTGLTFLNSVFTYDTTVEAWPERIFPPLPLVLQGDEIRSSSDQPDYLQGTPMHTDEVATVVAPHVLEHQLTFIRGMKTLVGTDYPSMFLLMAIMLFDPTQRGLQQPQVVECIQANYCHLLKQYVSWKFQNGLPPNPGDRRPGNFAHTCATSSHKPNNKPEGSDHSNLVSTSDLEGDSISSTIPKDSLLSWEEMARNYKGDPSDILKDSYYNSTNPCCYKRHEGTYFSPPYPPSPIHPKSIFPLLLTRLSDLQQTAYGYSSTPFLLQGTEVDEIGNLVARIEVFMSDLITSGFKSPNKDKDGNGGTGSGNAGVSGSNAENKEGKTKKREVNDKSAKGNEENNQPSNANRFEQSPKNARDCQNIPKSDEDYQRLSNRFGMNWITSSEDQELSQESCSSRGDDSFSGSSLSVMSIGSSIDDIVEALVSEEDGIMNVGREYEGKELAHSLGIWEMEKGSQEMQDTLTVDRTMTRKVNNASETSRLCKSDSYRETVSKGLNVEHPPSHLATNFVLGDSHHGWMREQNPCDLSLEHVHQELNKDGSLFTPQNYCINKREITFSRSGNLEIYVDGSVKRNPYHASIGRTSEFQNRTSFSCESQDTSNYPSNAERSHEGSNRVSLWDRIKATGRALLRLDSSTQLPGSWKPGINPSQTGVLLEDRRDHGNILEEQIERPESNSSGYVSTLSSPPPQMTMISDNGEFDPFGCASDWDDILQI